MVLRYILAAVIAYLLGSISTGILLSKLERGPDLHTVGSGNTGASNVMRTMGVRDGVITLVGDFAKALLACLIGKWLTGTHEGLLLAGLCAIIGHNWPVFFNFQGGKGVASSAAVMLMCYPIPAVICIAAAILVIAVTRYISLGSIAMLTLYAILVCLFWSSGSILVIIWAILLAGFCIFRHHENIRRLLQGTERKIGQKE